MFGLYSILELDREWLRFRKALEQCLKLVSHSELRKFIESAGSPPELLMLMPSCLADMAIQKRATSIVNTLIDQVLEVFEINAPNLKGGSSVLEILKTQFIEFYAKRIQTPSDFQTIASLVHAFTTTQQLPALGASELAGLVSEDPAFLLELMSVLRRDLTLSTSPIPGTNRSFHIHHALYPTKRLQRVPLDKLKGDLLHKVWVAEHHKFVNHTWSFQDKVPLEKTMPDVILAAIKQMLKSHQEPDGVDLTPLMQHFEKAKSSFTVPTFLPVLSKFCAIYDSTIASGLCALESLHGMMNSVTPSTPPLRDQVAYGVTITSKKHDLKLVSFVVAKGAKVLEVFRAELSQNLKVIDVNFEDKLSRCLHKYWPRVIAVEGSSSEFNVLFTQFLKEKATLHSQPEDGRLSPHYIIKRVEVAVAKSLTYGKDKQEWDYADLQAYSLACAAQDPLLEALKLRSRTSEVPNFRFDVSVCVLLPRNWLQSLGDCVCGTSCCATDCILVPSCR